MNKDIRLSVKFFEHPKTIKLERRLGIQGVKALIKLWMWAALNKPEGDLGHDAEDIEIAAQWSGEPELFSKALVDLRWLDHIDGRYRLHDWIEHNPWAAKDGTRSDKARFSRMAKTHPAICKALRERGIDEISASDFERLTKNNESLENLTNRSDLETNRSTPAPAPAPAPKEKTKEVVVDTVPALSARDGETGRAANRSPPTSTTFGLTPRAVVEIYESVLSGKPKCDIDLAVNTKKNIEFLMRAKKPGRDPDKWRRFFEYVTESRFLMSRRPGTFGRESFEVSLFWLAEPENFAKVISGKYHDGRAYA
ncbi:MAG TPA: hypothetical protein DCQ84_13935 [Candidatus Competibacteraceae bacterium]|nr:hypothetical protein [Candidatus Competibacteraceae bacterium]